MRAMAVNSDWRYLLVIADKPVVETTCCCLRVCIGKAMNSNGLCLSLLIHLFGMETASRAKSCGEHYEQKQPK